MNLPVPENERLTMPSEPQLAANRSRRQGMLARTVVLGASHHRFLVRLDHLRDHSKLKTIVESTLAENMAMARGRQMLPQLGNSDHDNATRAALASRSLVDWGRSLDVLSRYEARYDRQYSRSFANLMRLRKKHKIAKRTQISDAVYSLNLEIGLAPICTEKAAK